MSEPDEAAVAEVFGTSDVVVVASSILSIDTEETGLGNIINEPIAHSLDGKSFLKIWQNKILPKIDYCNPDLLILSAGFDAHKDDTISSINLKSEDYLDLTEMICMFANQNCDGRIVSILEGGYNLDALTESVNLHLQSLLSSV